MSRFADPKATKRFVLGDCECPGKPHDEDFMDLRSELSGMDLASLESAEPSARMRLLIVDWNLIGDDGQVAPIDDDYLARLYLDTFERINDWLTANVRSSTLPNGSGAPSRNGTAAERGPRTRTTQKKR